MSKEELISMMRNFRDALNKKDLEKSLSFFTEDADWVNPNGEFKGKEEIKNYLIWGFEISPDQRVIESGVKIIAEEDKARSYKDLLYINIHLRISIITFVYTFY